MYTNSGDITRLDTRRTSLNHLWRAQNPAFNSSQLISKCKTKFSNQRIVVVLTNPHRLQFHGHKAYWNGSNVLLRMPREVVSKCRRQLNLHFHIFFDVPEVTACTQQSEVASALSREILCIVVQQWLYRAAKLKRIYYHEIQARASFKKVSTLKHPKANFGPYSDVNSGHIQ